MKKPTSERRFLQAERVFLHEMSSPLMLAEGWLDRWAKTNPTIGDIAEYKQIKAQVEKMRGLLTERRERLVLLEKDES